MDSDRTVHAYFPGMCVVRYNRAGKWYLEPTRGNPGERQQVSVKAAAAQAREGLRAPGSRHYRGLPGGATFDKLVSGV